MSRKFTSLPKAQEALDRQLAKRMATPEGARELQTIKEQGGCTFEQALAIARRHSAREIIGCDELTEVFRFRPAIEGGGIIGDQRLVVFKDSGLVLAYRAYALETHSLPDDEGDTLRKVIRHIRIDAD